MKLIYNFIIVIFLLLNFTLLCAEDKIVYIDLDTVMNQSIVGKEQIESIEKNRAEISKNFELKAKELKDEEIQIISQKNLLKKEDYEKKVSDFKTKIDNFKNEKKRSIDELNQERVETIQIILEKIKPILAKYAEEKKINLVLQKQNVVIGKSDLDITQQILKIVDEKIKTIDQ